MKHCDKCSKDFDTTEVKCPACGKDIKDVTDNEPSTEEIVSSMTITGIL